MTINGTMQVLDDKRGAIRVEEMFDTDVDDLWQACTQPERLARWIANVSGDLQVGGIAQVTFTSTWSGLMKIEVCDAPHHLLLTGEAGTEDETQIEAWFSKVDGRTRLVVEDRGMPVDKLHFHAAGWQAHLEDLKRALVSQASVHPDGWSGKSAAAGWRARWSELVPVYEDAQTTKH